MPGPRRGGCFFSRPLFQPQVTKKGWTFWGPLGPCGSHPSLSQPPAVGVGSICNLSCQINPIPLAPSTGWGLASCLFFSTHFCPTGAQGIVSSGLIPSLVWKLQREEEGVQELLLDTLAACLMEDATEALASRAVPFLKEKLLSANSNIRSKAAGTLIAIR